MPRKIIEEKEISIPEARMILEKSQDLGEFQRRTLDYLVKYTKIEPKDAEKLISALTKKYKLDRREAIQIVNCMPKSPEELRTIISVKGKVVLSEELKSILDEIDKYRVRKGP
ncbi:MAG: RNA polymerase Rpb4 family protein [Candidatus Bathyarchaeia archaeon]